MKIRAKQVKPGMVIGIKRGDRFDDICLVLATTGMVTVQYTHLDYQMAYGGALVGSIDGDDIVKIISGKKRKFIIKQIKSEVFKNLHDIEKLVDMIRLIEAMEESQNAKNN